MFKFPEKFARTLNLTRLGVDFDLIWHIISFHTYKLKNHCTNTAAYNTLLKDNMNKLY